MDVVSEERLITFGCWPWQCARGCGAGFRLRYPDPPPMPPTRAPRAHHLEMPMDADDTTPLVSISQHDLELALAEWESEARAGDWPPVDPAKPVEEVARESAEYLFPRLQRITAGVAA